MNRGPLLVVIAALALVLAAGALVLQFVVPAKTGGTSLKVAFVNTDDAVTVLLDAVSDIRQRSQDKAQEIADLRARYNAGTVPLAQYQKQSNILRAEFVDVNISVYAGVIDRMIAASAFSDMRTGLRSLREQVDGLLDVSKSLVIAAKGSATSEAELQSRQAQVQADYSSLEKAVTQVCSLKLMSASQKVAISKGFDLVVMRAMILYSDTDSVTDITELVKAEMETYL
jgi:Skp family chaperone for outer membrane proteins